MTSAGTETTTISLPDATTGSTSLVKEGKTACAPGRPSNNRGAGNREQREARRLVGSADPQLQWKPPPEVMHPTSRRAAQAQTTWAARGAGLQVPKGRGKQDACAYWPPASREHDPSKWASRGREQRSERPSPGAREPRARAPALRSLVEPAREALGTCRRQPLAWRAPGRECPLPSPDPFPAHRVRFGTAPVIRAGPALRRGLSPPEAARTGVRRSCSRDPPVLTPPRGDGRRAAPARTEGVIARPPSVRLVPAGTGTEHACATRAGGRARCGFSKQQRRCTPPFHRSSRAVTAAAAAAAAARRWGTEGSARRWAGQDRTGPNARHKRLSRQEGPWPCGGAARDCLPFSLVRLILLFSQPGPPARPRSSPGAPRWRSRPGFPTRRRHCSPPLPLL